MTHDATHCADFKADCPMNCYRAQLTADLQVRWQEFIATPISWSHFDGTEECKKAVISMTIPEAIERLRVMIEPGQDQNNKALRIAIEVMEQTQKRLEQERRTK